MQSTQQRKEQKFKAGSQTAHSAVLGTVWSHRTFHSWNRLYILKSRDKIKQMHPNQLRNTGLNKLKNLKTRLSFQTMLEVLSHRSAAHSLHRPYYSPFTNVVLKHMVAPFSSPIAGHPCPAPWVWQHLLWVCGYMGVLSPSSPCSTPPEPLGSA